MTKTEMLRRMPSSEITEWKMYYRLLEIERNQQKSSSGRREVSFGD